jgi:hypothetical protein
VRPHTLNLFLTYCACARVLGICVRDCKGELLEGWRELGVGGWGFMLTGEQSNWLVNLVIRSMLNYK